MSENHIATLEELLNGDPSETLTERRYTALDPENNPLVIEYRTAQDYTERMRKLEELSAEMDLKFAYLLED
jgi:hypothetical protein